jgi:hypothetical protein
MLKEEKLTREMLVAVRTNKNRATMLVLEPS